ncbi:MAG: hypothetical protein CMF98_01415 [Candidatus Marinimicrobia bacterium]|nr:hypothetical protein [Candidatus Neomarinimicrobiota bacterium]
MVDNKNDKEDQLLIQIITMFTQQSWISMGKLKNPVTDKTETKLDEASFYIEVIEMMKNKMEGNLNSELSSYIETSLNNLKINYLEESKKTTVKESSNELKNENNSKEKNEKEDINENK